MKRINRIQSMVLVLFCLLHTSCKKYYACRCNTTVSTPSQNDIYKPQTVKFSQKMTKSQAQSVCDHERENINTTYYNTYTNNGKGVTGATFKTSCALE